MNREGCEWQVVLLGSIFSDQTEVLVLQYLFPTMLVYQCHSQADCTLTMFVANMKNHFTLSSNPLYFRSKYPLHLIALDHIRWIGMIKGSKWSTFSSSHQPVQQGYSISFPIGPLQKIQPVNQRWSTPIDYKDAYIFTYTYYRILYIILINMIGGTERHLPRQHVCVVRPTES